MPPSGFNERATRGLLEFISGCYYDLLEEVRSGKHENYEQAIEHELKQIETALSQLHIDAEGNLVKREPVH